MPWIRLDGSPAVGDVVEKIDSEGQPVTYVAGEPTTVQPNIFGVTPEMLAERDNPTSAVAAVDLSPILKGLVRIESKLNTIAKEFGVTL